MNEELRVSLVQTYINWENTDANLERYGKLIQSKNLETDLIVLPETFPTGFTMHTEQYAQEMDGTVVNWMKKLAKEQYAAVCGSAIIRDKGKFYNRLIVVTEEQKIEFYDKKHLFRMAEENSHFSSGKKRQIVQIKGWKIALWVCYDLRFPVWSRNVFSGDTADTLKADYDVMLYVANWPKPRVSAWNKLLAARAIENQSYVVGVNRIGRDGNTIEYSGNSRVIDPKGEDILALKEEEDIITVRLSKKDLLEFRRSFPVGLDAD